MQIQIPTECPSCSSKLVWVNDQLYCKSNECGDKQYKAIEHFASTLKIKGLGPSTIRKLDIRNISEIYSLESVEELLGSTKLASKLIEEIEQSKSAPLNIVLPALGIPLVGKSAADKLSSSVTNLRDITEKVCKDAGLGDKATHNLMEFLRTFTFDLPFSFEFAKKSSVNGVVCITGKLVSFKNKAEATKVLEARGYTVKPSITKEVTILINEGGQDSAKTIKARESGVKIVTNLQEFLGE